MTLSSILKNVKPLSVVGNAEVEITGVDIDSRKVGEGHLFVAIKGITKIGRASCRERV